MTGSWLFRAMTGALAAVGATISPAAAWEPQEPVELIVMAGEGGGADQIARLLQGLIEDKALSPVPFVVINKPGESGAEALRALQDKAGDDHTLLLTLSSFYTTPLIDEELGVDVTQFTPIGRMARDTFLLWVRSDREDIETLDDYVAAVQAAEGAWTIGGTGSGQEDSVLTAMLEATLGVDVTYIAYPGGGTAARALSRDEVDSTVNNPAEQSALMEAGETMAIVQFSAERMEAFPDVPTVIELGHDIEYSMQRSISGPPDMSDEAQQWYIDLFATLYESEEWQAFCAADGLDCSEWVAGDDLAAFHAAQLERQRALVEAVGADAIMGE